jgi:amino acid adenylation domain-containing protein/thioester reductase-like protein
MMPPAEWNRTEEEYPEDKGIGELFEEAARQRGDAVALLFGEESWSYARLSAHSSRLARYLASLGNTPDSCVALFLERSPLLISSLLSVLKAGSAYLALDTNLPPVRLRYLLEDSQARIVLVDAQTRDRLPATSARVVCLGSPEIETLLADMPATAPRVSIEATSLAYVAYTSGSTGQPKGVEVTHRAVIRLVYGQRYARFAVDEVWLQHSPIAFDASTFEIWGSLLHGARLVVAPPGPLSLETLTELVRQNGVTTLWLTTGLFHHVVDHAPSLLAGVCRLLTGGEVVSPGHMRRAFSLVAPGGRIVNCYGPTENTTFSTCHVMQRPEEVEEPVPIGKPIGNSTAYVVGEAGELAPIGVEGELWVGGVGVARGYLNRPGLTAEKFLPNPFGPGRVYRTGDRARWRQDGKLDFLGRLDQQIKIRGFRVEIGEIEAVLSSYGAVKNCVVMVREEAPGEKRLVAYVVPKEGEDLSSVALRERLGQNLPEYMVPARYVFLPALPLTPNGKVDRAALPAPQIGRASSDACVAPRDPTEQRLVEIWREVLSIGEIGIEDDFFSLGGHSLLAMRVASRIRQAFGVEALRDLFEARTIARLAERLKCVSGERHVAPLFGDGVLRRNEPQPLSSAQLRLWLFAKFLPGNVVYNIPSAWRLRGALDTEILRAAFEVVAHRHEALRTIFIEVDGALRQVIRPPEHWSLPLEEIGETALEAALSAEARAPFDITREFPLRTRLLRLGPEDHVLTMTLHHIAADGWSMGVLLSELGEAYAAILARREPRLAPLPAQYADYAAWQRKVDGGEARAAQLSYWKRTLAGLAPLALPTDYPPPPASGHQGARVPLVLPAELVTRIDALARRQGATRYMVLLAVLQALLMRYTGQRDIAVGTPVAGRGRVEIEGLIGFFVNMLVMRANLSGNPSFHALLARVKEVVLGALAHEEAPFEQVVESLGAPRDPGLSPLFRVAFALQTAPAGELALPGLAATPLEQETGTAKFDLSLELAERSGALMGNVEYKTELFTKERIHRFAGHFLTMLEGATRAPETALSALPLLTAGERKVFVEWNRTEEEYPEEKNIGELFEEVAEKRADAVALLFGEESWSYAELSAHSNRLARYLLSLGSPPDSCVALCLERSPLLIASLLSVLKAGSAYLPLDPDYPEERLRFMLRDAGCRVVLTQRSLAARLGFLAAGRELVMLDAVDLSAFSAERLTNEERPEALHAQNLAYVIYTSGSTGQPKGVALTHRNLGHIIVAQRHALGVTANSRILQCASFSFDAAVWEVFMALGHGATLVLAPRDDLLPGGALEHLINRHGIDFITLAPSVLALLEPGAVPSLRVLVSGFEACPASVARKWAEAGRTIINAYGPTECTAVSTLMSVDGREIPPIGKPVRNAKAYVVGVEGELVPIGVEGELWIGGAGVARGYLNRPGLTAEKFLPNPFGQGRVYRTGDRARWCRDGKLDFLGRLDQQIKIRGFRIEIGEIESVLAAHPRVRACAVLARQDAARDRRLVAYVVGDCSPDELREYLRLSLPPYMVPSQSVFLSALPLTPNGKVDRLALPAPDPDASSGQTYVEPRTPLEAKLAALWAEVLGVERVGVHDDFFSLGGHSLLAVALATRIERSLGASLALSTLFRGPSPAALARILEQREDGSHRPPLEADAVLPFDIRPPQGRPPARVSSVLLTGVTGFVGAFALHELLRVPHTRVTCLVRGINDDDARARLEGCLAGWGLEIDRERVDILAGDLAAPRLGLAPARWRELSLTLDGILHSGAQVQHARSYGSLRAANVGGTLEVLRLAALERAKRVCFVSTLNVTAATPGADEETPLRPPWKSSSYAQTKWVADRLALSAAAAGHDVSIARLGLVLGDTLEGRVQVSGYWAAQALRAAILTRSIPARLDLRLNAIPVDLVARALVAMLLDRDTPRVAHLGGRERLTTEVVVSALGRLGVGVQVVSWEDWVARVRAASADDSELARLLTMVERKPGRARSGPVFHSGEALLGRLGLDLPTLAETLASTAHFLLMK